MIISKTFSDKYFKNSLLISLLISLIFCVIYLFLFEFIRYNDADTINFVNAAKILFGNSDVIDTQSRITKPVILLLPGLLNKLYSIDIKAVMLWQNIILFIFSGVFLSKLISVFGFEKNLQYLGVFIFFTIQPIAVHSLELINDIAGYFFSILIMYLYFLWRKQKNISIKQYIILSILIVLGILSKESAGLAVLVIIADSIVSFSLYRFIKNSMMLLISGFIIYIIQWFIKIHFTTTDLLYNIVEEFYLNDGYYIKIEQIVHSFDAYWLFIGLGILSLIKNIQHNNSKLLLFAILITVPTLFIWSTVQDRTIAIIAPLFILSILFAINKLNRNKIYYLLVIITGVLNITITFLIYKYNISNLLKYYLFAYSIVFILILYYNAKPKLTLFR